MVLYEKVGLGKSNQFEVLASDEQRDKSIMSLNKYGDRKSVV